MNEAVWPSSLGARFENRKVTGLSPALATKLELLLGRPKSNFSVMFVNSQLVCLPPVEIFKPVMFSFFQFKWHACELAH